MQIDKKFQHHLDVWIGATQDIIRAEYENRFPNVKVPKLVQTNGRKYIKIISQSNQESVFAFIDQLGNILKPATYSKPAKHVRGNIFDMDYGVNCVTPFGIAYLR